MENFRYIITFIRRAAKRGNGAFANKRKSYDPRKPVGAQALLSGLRDQQMQDEQEPTLKTTVGI